MSLERLSVLVLLLALGGCHGTTIDAAITEPHHAPRPPAWPIEVFVDFRAEAPPDVLEQLGPYRALDEVPGAATLIALVRAEDARARGLGTTVIAIARDAARRHGGDGLILEDWHPASTFIRPDATGFDFTFRIIRF